MSEKEGDAVVFFSVMSVSESLKFKSSEDESWREKSLSESEVSSSLDADDLFRDIFVLTLEAWCSCSTLYAGLWLTSPGALSVVFGPEVL